MILCVRYPQNLELQGIEGLYQKNKRTHDLCVRKGLALEPQGIQKLTDT